MDRKRRKRKKVGEPIVAEPRGKGRKELVQQRRIPSFFLSPFFIELFLFRRVFLPPRREKNPLRAANTRTSRQSRLIDILRVPLLPPPRPWRTGLRRDTPVVLFLISSRIVMKSPGFRARGDGFRGSEEEKKNTDDGFAGVKRSDDFLRER